MDTKIVQGSSPRMRGTRVMQCDNRACGGIIPAYAGNTIQMRKAIFNNRDHPRVCGEHPWYLTSTPSGWRIIPAYAGNTPKRRSVAPRSRDHPRVCGEHDIAWCSLRRSAGSSPRMRGTRDCLWSQRRPPGIIPAYAGNTMVPSPTWKIWRDHPRVCGEHFRTACGVRCGMGSSPRMRGTRSLWMMMVGSWRIIPAYAGNTILSSPMMGFKWDHPRVCGEHPAARSDWNRPTGSSPRMRGTLPSPPSVPVRVGIIPAYAGNTLYPMSHGTLHRDHPRVCGEHHDMKVATFSSQGSSPRMRGTPLPDMCSTLRTGIIPAYAGNTDGVHAQVLCHRDHPRVCGEHFLCCLFYGVSLGSSPRMRGTPTCLYPTT